MTMLPLPREARAHGWPALFHLFGARLPRLHKYLGKLVRSYAMDALETGQRKRKAPAEAAVRQFLAALQSAAGERFAALGEGEDIRLKGAGIAGGALAADGRVVHLAGYAV